MANEKSIRMMHFELVEGCQLRCVGCPVSTLQPKVKSVSADDFKRCMLNIDVERIHYLRLFNFGETLLHSNLLSIFEVIEDLPHIIDEVEISTNGQFAYWDDFEAVIKTGRLNTLVVSCDGDGTPESYERLRPPAKWHKLIDFMQRADDLKQRYAPNMRLMARVICDDDNEKRRWFQLLAPMGWLPEFRKWLILPDTEYDGYPEKTKPEGSCRYLRMENLLYVAADGTVIPCCAHPKAGDFGNLHDSAYSEIILRDEKSKMIRDMDDHRKDMTICSQCGIS